MIDLLIYGQLTIFQPNIGKGLPRIKYVEQAQATPATDNRVSRLAELFRRYKSPLEPYAKTFIEEADANKIDWRILPAISVVESTAGKHVPKHSPYNVFGWGCSTGAKCIKFDSYPDAIKTVAFALGNKRAYKEFQRTGSIDSLSRRYCGGDSKAWATKLKKVMDQIK